MWQKSSAQNFLDPIAPENYSELHLFTTAQDIQTPKHIKESEHFKSMSKMSQDSLLIAISILEYPFSIGLTAAIPINQTTTTGVQMRMFQLLRALLKIQHGLMIIHAIRERLVLSEIYHLLHMKIALLLNGKERGQMFKANQTQKQSMFTKENNYLVQCGEYGQEWNEQHLNLSNTTTHPQPAKPYTLTMMLRKEKNINICLKFAQQEFFAQHFQRQRRSQCHNV